MSNVNNDVVMWCCSEAFNCCIFEDFALGLALNRNASYIFRCPACSALINTVMIRYAGVFIDNVKIQEPTQKRTTLSFNVTIKSDQTNVKQHKWNVMKDNV